MSAQVHHLDAHRGFVPDGIESEIAAARAARQQYNARADEYLALSYEQDSPSIRCSYVNASVSLRFQALGMDREIDRLLQLEAANSSSVAA